MSRLSIVIPAYNEARRLPESLQKIRGYFGDTWSTLELIVVDDGSRDDTVAVVRAFDAAIKIIELKPNRGKGYAVRRGMLAATGERVLFTDADLSTPISEIEKLQRAIDAGADVAIGSRAIDRSLIAVHQPWLREQMGKVFNGWMQLLCLRGIKDSQCGFKLFTRQAVKDVFIHCQQDGFCFDVECLAVAKLLGYAISEVPVRWLNSADTRVNVLIDSIKMYLDLWRLRYRLRVLARQLGRPPIT